MVFLFPHLLIALHRTQRVPAARHERPVLGEAVSIVHLDDDLVVVHKPPSVPVSFVSLVPSTHTNSSAPLPAFSGSIPNTSEHLFCVFKRKRNKREGTIFCPILRFLNVANVIKAEMFLNLASFYDFKESAFRFVIAFDWLVDCTDPLTSDARDALVCLMRISSCRTGAALASAAALTMQISRN